MQAHAQRAGIIHCKHNVRNEFDFRSDVARWHQIRHCPSFLVFADGAMIDRLVLPDTRGRATGPSRQVCHSSTVMHDAAQKPGTQCCGSYSEEVKHKVGAHMLGL